MFDYFMLYCEEFRNKMKSSKVEKLDFSFEAGTGRF